MPYMSGADALVKMLVQEGVNVVFGIPGVQTMDAADAIYRDGHIRWISPRHEQTAAYMALGYAMTTGKTGVAVVLPGPGALNTMAAVGTAYATSAPVLIISGQVETHHIGFHRGVLHELDEQLDIFRPLTKYAARATRAEDIPDLLAQALRQLKTQRPRPALVEVPYDLWAKTGEMIFGSTERYPPLPPESTDVEKALAILKEACHPLIIAGRGAVKAEVGGEIRELAERLPAPVIMTPEAQGLLPTNHPFHGGNFFLWRNPLFARADAVLVIGSRLRASGNSRLELKPATRVIQVDCDSGELGRNHRIDLGISADAKLTLKTILASLGSRNASLWKEDQIARVRQSLRQELEKIAPLQMEIIDRIYGAIGDEGIIVPDITNLGYYCDLAYPVNRPYSYVDSAYFGTLGFAFPTALGAKVAHPERPVVAICGDGGFAYASAELATAVQEKINTITIVFCDDAYGTVTNIQRRQFGGRFIGNRLHNPDYVKFAEAFGAAGMRAKSPEELGRMLSRAVSASQPVLVEMPVPSLEEPWAVLK